VNLKELVRIMKVRAWLSPLWHRSTLPQVLNKGYIWLNLTNCPVVLEDAYGIRFIRYPWDIHPIHQLINRKHDRTEYEVMSLLIRPGDLVFDVGANTGLHSVFASRLVGSSGKVYAFEPVPDTFWMLREVLALNRCENVVSLQKAICDRVGTVGMNLFESNYSVWNTLGNPVMITPGGQRIVPTVSIEVPSDTLDNFVSSEGIERIDFLKVDVEGFEKFVFVGAERILQERRINYICFEISHGPLKGAGVVAREVFEVLASHGYLTWCFNVKTHTFQGPIYDSTEPWTNYFASWQDLSTLQLSRNAKRA
jgi:FkbM family methyltransferase